MRTQIIFVFNKYTVKTQIMGHPNYGTFFEIFITILYTNTLKPYPTYGSFYPKITSKNMTHKLGYDCIMFKSITMLLQLRPASRAFSFSTHSSISIQALYSSLENFWTAIPTKPVEQAQV